MSIEVYIDGASRGNPGESGIGIVINYKNGNKKEIKKYLGIGTNNQAEYTALITALESLKEESKNKIIIHTDSQLVANQINGLWKVKDPDLKLLFLKAKESINNFSDLTIKHIRREFNKEADRVANDAINEYFNK
ncbi:MAG: reverse transcriptase-like protein [Candidatus Dadabacteria bacterium]|nr:reverse transcriptase-like protein [Candidatus Dadabacteria bacterium]NIQ16993.1 reverse transcriptase-like protein [Candidatus Dadabacteria bacterium]